MIHRTRDYPKEWSGALLEGTPAEKHPLLPSPDGAIAVTTPGGSGPSAGGQSQAARPEKAAEKPAQAFIDPLQAFAAEKDVDDDPLGAHAKGAGKAVVDNTPIGVTTKVEVAEASASCSRACPGHDAACMLRKAAWNHTVAIVHGRCSGFRVLRL